MKKTHLLTLVLSSIFLVACGGSGGGGGGSSDGAVPTQEKIMDMFPKEIKADGNSFDLEVPGNLKSFISRLEKVTLATNGDSFAVFNEISQLTIGGIPIHRVIEISDAPKNNSSFKLAYIYATPKEGWEKLSGKTADGKYIPLTQSIILNIGKQVDAYLVQFDRYVRAKYNIPPLFSAAIRSTPSDLTTERGTATTSTMRQGETGSIDLRESFGQKYDLKLPLHIRVVGDTNLKETSSTLGSVFYKAGGALFGVAQAYANQGNNFEASGKQLETSSVSTFTLGKAFAEFQSGIISADKVSGSNWSGSRQAMFLGYDIASGISPFVQVSARQLSQENGVNHTENGAYLGTTVDATKANAFFNTTSLMTIKSGVVSDKASMGAHSRTESSFDHSVHMEQGFGSEGVSFNTSVGLSTKQKTNLKISVGFSQ